MLHNKIVCITGASSGIGNASAHYFAKAGARLLLCARRMEQLISLKQELERAYHVRTHVFLLDVRQQEAVQNAFQQLPAEWQLIDILINNAGLAAGLEPIQDGKIDDWNDMIDTNVKGLLYVTRAVLPQMVSRNTGHVINIGSVAGHEVYPKGAVYCASKHAIRAISQGLRMDLFGTKVRVTSIDPGAVETNFSMVRFKGNEERASAVYVGMTPLTPNDIADVILYCANCPPHVNISDLIIMPTDQACATMVYRDQ